MPRKKRLRRKDLKQPDEFQTFTRQAIEWASEHTQVFTWAGIGILVALIAIGLTISFRNARGRDSNADLGRAMAILRAGDVPAAAAELSQVARRWPSTPAGDMAAILAINTELQRDNYDSAILLIEEALDSGSLPEYLRQEVLFAWGYALQQKDASAGAMDQYKAAADLDGPYKAPAILAQARLLEQQGDMKKAQKLYSSFVDGFPDLPDVELIRARLES